MPVPCGHQTSTVPIDQPGRGAGNFFDGRDKIISTAPVAVTQTGFATDPGTVHAGAVQVLDVDKSGLRFDIPIGQDANYNELFDYVGAVVVATEDGTTVQIDADANGSFEITVDLDEGEIYRPGRRHQPRCRDHRATSRSPPTSASGDIGATYEGRFVELYPTAIWSDAMVSPVGSHDTGDGRTRAFLYNPGASAITIDVVTGSGSTATIPIGAGAQGSFVLPQEPGARFSSRNGEPFYGMQMITSEGASTSAWDWGFTLVPQAAVTPSVIVPYGAGSDGLTNNYSPVWFAADANTRVYVDLDGDPATGGLTDPGGDRYNFHCDVTSYQSWTAYDDGQNRCYRPSQSANQSGGDKDMTGARLYSLTGARLSSAWGQRPNYVGGSPGPRHGDHHPPVPHHQPHQGIRPHRRRRQRRPHRSGRRGHLHADDDQPGHRGRRLGGADRRDPGRTPPTRPTAPPSTSSPRPTTASRSRRVPLDADSPTGGLPVGTLPAGSTRVAVVLGAGGRPDPAGRQANSTTTR